jgi:hypothetical protein
MAVVHLDTAVDTSADYLVSFGGVNGAGAPVNTLARLDYTLFRAPTWSGVALAAASAPVPPARARAAAVYIPRCSNTTTGVSQCVLFYGGVDAAGARLGDAHVLRVQTTPDWLSPPQLAVAAPSPRHSASLVVGANSRHALMFGGDTAGGVSDDLFIVAPNRLPGAVRPEECTNLAQGRGVAVANRDPLIGGANSRATDGVTSGVHNPAATLTQAATDPTVNTCTHSNSSGWLNPWVRVDLGSLAAFQAVQWYSRTDCDRLVGSTAQRACQTRNQGFQVWASRTDFPPWTSGEATAVRCDVDADDLEGGTALIPCAATARYVWIMLPGASRQLAVCELRVLQQRPWVWRKLSGLIDAAELVSSSQVEATSSWSYGSAWRAVDGVLTNAWDTQSCFLTDWTNIVTYVPGAYQELRIDLGRSYDVNSIQIWPVLTGPSIFYNNPKFMTRVKIFVGESTNAALDTQCNVPENIAPVGAATSTTISCPSRGRFVLVRRYQIPTDLDDTLAFCEIKVWANALLDHPPARAGHAAVSFRGNMVVYGGYDRSGARLNDVRFFNLRNLAWAPPAQPIGGAPASRAYTALLVSSVNALMIHGGSGSGTQSALADSKLVAFPRCPVVDATGIVGVPTCTGWGTDCDYTCNSAGLYNDGPRGSRVVCDLDGSLEPATPPCDYGGYIAPLTVTATRGPAGSNSAVVSWTPPATVNPAVTHYWVRPRTDGTSDQEEYYTFDDGSLPARYTFRDPATDLANNIRGVSKVTTWGGRLAFQAAPNSICSPTRSDCPFVTLDTLPTGMSRNDFVVETYVSFDDQSDGYNGFAAGIGIVDDSGYAGKGALEFFLGLTLNWPTYSVIWRSTAANTSSAPFSVSVPLAPGVVQPGQGVYLRVTRSTAVGGRYEASWRRSPLFNWVPLPYLPGQEDMHNRSLTNGNIRGAMVVLNQITNLYVTAWFDYFRMGPAACLTTGPTFVVPASQRSVNVTGLTPGGRYSWGVQASVNGGVTYLNYTYSPWLTLLAAPDAVYDAAPGQYVEVARGRPARMSTPQFGSNAGLAVDGGTSQALTNGSATGFQCAVSTAITAGNAGSPLFWQVDLGALTDVWWVTLYLPQPLSPGAVSVGFRVLASDVPDWQRGEECPVTTAPTNLSSTIGPGVLAYGCPLSGRYITVVALNAAVGASLQLCEVQVWAQNSCPARPAVNATRLSGNCNAGAPYGAVCTQECLPGQWPVSGAGVARCAGDDWDVPPLVCAPMCPLLPPPAFTDTCEMTLLTEDFSRVDPATNTSLIPHRWTPLFRRTEWGTHWFVSTLPGQANLPYGSYVTASSRLGCSNDLILVPSLTDITDWRGNFRFSAKVLAQDRSGIAFRVTPDPTLSYYRFVGDRWSNSFALEVVENEAVRRIAASPEDTYDITKNQFSTFTVECKGFTYTFYVDGKFIFTVTDSTLTSGNIGLYAQSEASFDDVVFTTPCETCEDTGEGETCTYNPFPGMLINGTRWWPVSSPANVTARTCRGGQWDPPLAPVFTLPPPVLGPMAASVQEFSPVNTPVGSPMGLAASVPGMQIGYEIVSGNAGPGGSPAFFIDSCDGTLTVLNPLISVRFAPTYTLLVRAFIVGQPGVSSNATYTVTVTPKLDTPPAADAQQTLRLPENSAPGTLVGSLAYNATAAAGPLVFRLALDGAGGRFAVNATTGAVTVSPTNTQPLDFETPPSSWVLSIEFHYVAYPAASTTVLTTVALTDANDVPAVAALTSVRAVDTATVGTAFTPSLSTVVTDQDTANAGSPFLFPARYALAPFDSYAALCGVPLNATSTYPTVNGTAGDPLLFAIDSISGAVRVAALPAQPWATRPAFAFSGVATRAVYPLCVSITDTAPVAGPPRGALVIVAVSSQTSASEPVIVAVALGNASTTFPTAGGGRVFFTVDAAAPLAAGAVLRASYSNMQSWPGGPPVVGGSVYNATACTATNTTTFVCTMAPGVGRLHRWTVYYAATTGAPLEVMAASVDAVTSYDAPRVTAVTGNANVPTVGGTILTFSGANFGPVSTPTLPNPTPITVTYGTTGAGEFTCAYQLSIQTQVRCVLGAGAGASLPWTLNVGNQAISSATGSSGGGNTSAALGPITYARPTIRQVRLSDPTVGNVSAPLGANDTAAGLPASGGSTFYVVGTNFGPDVADVAVTYASGASVLAATNCVRWPAGSQTALRCLTAPGVGQNLAVVVTVEGQASAPSSGDTSAGLGLSYAGPVITAVRNSGGSSSLGYTDGGETFFVIGTGFGSTATPATDIVVRYGMTPGVWTFTAVGCSVTQGGAGQNTITCDTAPGSGSNLFFQVSLAGVTSPVFASTADYGPPEILSFSGPGAGAGSTAGGDAIVITGLNFGPTGGAYEPKVEVHYTARVVTTPPGGAAATVRTLFFSAQGCTVTTAHEVITCRTSPGAGAALSWNVVVDGVASVTPTTSYCAPSVTNVTLVDGSPLPTGGLVPWQSYRVLIRGRCFGPPDYLPSPNTSVIPVPAPRSLIDGISYGGTGSEYDLRGVNSSALLDFVPLAYHHRSDSAIEAVVGPGSGASNRMTITVGGQSAVTAGSLFGFRTPVVSRVVPNSLPVDAEAALVTVQGTNFPLLDVNRPTVILLGTATAFTILQARVPTTLAGVTAATNPDGTQNISFLMPPWTNGANIGIRVAALAVGSTTPVAPSALSALSSFSFQPPAIETVAVQPARFAANANESSGLVFVCPFPDNSTQWECDGSRGTLLQLVVTGTNFGMPSSPANRILEARANNIGSLYSANNVFVQQWTNTRIIAYTYLLQGFVQVRINAIGWNGVAVNQNANQPFSQWTNMVPQVLAISGHTGMPGTGCPPAAVAAGTCAPLRLTVNNLNTTLAVAVFIGNASCPLLTPSGALVTNSLAEVITPQQPGPSWQLTCAPPPGQGVGLAVRIVSTPGLAMPQLDTDTGFDASYAAPVVTAFAVYEPGSGTWDPTPDPAAVGSLVTVNTTGARLRLYGRNLGTSPVITIADGPHPSGSDVLDCSPVNGTQACVEFAVPAGEGSGMQFPEFALTGYTVTLSAGGQRAGEVLFLRYAPAYVTSVALAGGSLSQAPTTGGTQVTITGGNFGQTPNGRDVGASRVDAIFGRPIDGPAGALGCQNEVRLSHTTITCTLPEGSGTGLSAQVSVAGVVGAFSPPVLTFEPPQLTAAYAVVAAAPFPTPNPRPAQNISLPTVPTRYLVIPSQPVWVPANGSVIAPGDLPVGAALPPGVSGASRVTGGPVVPGGAVTLTAPGDVDDYMATYVTLVGTNFGPAPASATSGVCVLLVPPPSSLVRPPAVCNGVVDYATEGEVHTSAIISWSQTRIVLRLPRGVGSRTLDLNLRGARLANTTEPQLISSRPAGTVTRVSVVYDAPMITSLTPRLVDTDGTSYVAVMGYGFGWAPPNAAGVPFDVRTLPATSAHTLSTDVVPQVFIDGATDLCVTDGLTVAGGLPSVVRDCVTGPSAVAMHTPNVFVVRMPAGVSANKPVSVRIREPASRQEDPPVATLSSGSPFNVSYAPPVVVRLDATIARVTAPGVMDTSTGRPRVFTMVVHGTGFGNPSLLPPLAGVDAVLSVNVGGTPCANTIRDVSEATGELRLMCSLDLGITPVGVYAVTVTVGNQQSVDVSGVAAYTVACDAGYYGRPGELCAPCPVGATCLGYDGSRNGTARFLYPAAKYGWFDLGAGVWTPAGQGGAAIKPMLPAPDMMTQCPASVTAANGNNRTVCVAPCMPSEACMAGNTCADGYTSKAPYYRCAACADGYYRRYNRCEPCPSSASGLFIGYIVVVALGAALAYGLSKSGTVIPLAAVALDFVQVLGVMQYTRVDWPLPLRELFHVASAFYLNVDLVAPECTLGPAVAYQQKWAFVLLLPITFGALLALIQGAITLYRLVVMKRRDKRSAGMSTLLATQLLVMYALYIYVTRTLLDPLSCVPPTPPLAPGELNPERDARYFLPEFTPCSTYGGFVGPSLWMGAAAVVGIIVYTGLYPAFVGFWLWRHRELVMEDQLLRAKGTGHDRLTNPHALTFRKRWGRLYYQFKPDNWYWILMVLGRKMSVVAVQVIFNRNASYQLASIVIVLMVAYALQATTCPYMGPGDAEDVLRTHTAASYTSALHARLREALASIESRGKRPTRKNLMDYNGHIDRGALLGVMRNYLFNFNTVEAVQLFTLTMVALVGLMLQSQSLDDYGGSAAARAAATNTIIVLVALTLLYLAVVTATDAYVSITESRRERQLVARRRSSKGAKELGVDRSASSRSLSADKSMRGEEMAKLAVDQTFNPLHAKGGAGKGTPGTPGGSSSGRSLDASGDVAAARSVLELATASAEPPTREMWRAVSSASNALSTQVDSLSLELARLRLQLEQARAGQQQSLMAAAAAGGTNPLVNNNSAKSAFQPMAIASRFSLAGAGGRGSSGGERSEQ